MAEETKYVPYAVPAMRDMTAVLCTTSSTTLAPDMTTVAGSSVEAAAAKRLQLLSFPPPARTNYAWSRPSSIGKSVVGSDWMGVGGKNAARERRARGGGGMLRGRLWCFVHTRWNSK